MPSAAATSASPAPNPPQLLSARHVPGRDKVDALRDFYGRELMRVDLRPHPHVDVPEVDYHARIMALDEGTVHCRVTHSPMHLLRTPDLMRDGNDDIYLCLQARGTTIRGAGCEFTAEPGGYVLLSKARMHEAFTPLGGLSECIQVQRSRIARLAPGLEEAPMCALPAATPGAALALAYGSLIGEDAGLQPAQRALAIDHLHELLAAVIAPASQAGLPPGRAAATAPRLALVKRAIHAQLHHSSLSLAQIARQHHLTPRQVQRLFAAEGTCFSDFVREARLARTRAMLLDPAHAHRRVLAIALDNGFADIPAFNRAFKRRFGLAPTELREGR